MKRASIAYALLAALLFGCSTPIAKILVDNLSPFMLAGLLYLGSGGGLILARLVRDRGSKPSGIQPGEWRWLFGAIIFGGVIGPVALMYGLLIVTGSVAALLLNLESVFTALIAWKVFKENSDRRVVLGMTMIALAGILLSWQSTILGESASLGLLLIILAALCWAIDNNFTRKVSVADSLFIAGSKGMIAGLTNCAISVIIATKFPSFQIAISAMVLGLFGYGISLVLFVVALRELGAARTGAYFATAPFFGSVTAILILSESLAPFFWVAFVLMIIGVWLHLTEIHSHEHTHEILEHEHVHSHDEHHQHSYDNQERVTKPHSHWHRHYAIKHSHGHFPDVHHQHSH